MTATADVNLQPTLAGPTLQLRPLQPADFASLYAVARDPLIWEQHPDPLRWQRQVFENFFNNALTSKGALLITEAASGQVIGSSRYYDWDATIESVAIGYTFLARSHWGGKANPELKRLMLDHAFTFARTVWFHVGVQNFRSRRAMEKIGGRFSHEAPLLLNGSENTHAHYRIDRTD
jgi:RimJ/RimL family protein N-acetyltransferase